MNEVSSFFSFFLFLIQMCFGYKKKKKIDFDLSKYQIFCVVCRKKWFLEIKIQIYVVMIKKKRF